MVPQKSPLDQLRCYRVAFGTSVKISLNESKVSHYIQSNNAGTTFPFTGHLEYCESNLAGAV